MIKWLDNIWYHYKWRIIIIAFFVFIAVLGLSQMIQKTNYDALFMYVGDDEISGTAYNEIVSVLTSYAEDYTKEGKTEINFSRTAYIPNPEIAYDVQINSSSEEFLSTLVVQSYYIYIMRSEIYERYKGAFTPLTDIFDGEIPENAYDDCAVYLSDTALSRTNEAFEVFSDDVVIALKAKPYNASKKADKAETKSFQNHLNIFRKLVVR